MPSFSATTGGAAPVADVDRSVGPVVSRTAHFDAPLALACGRTLPQYDLAYETYGELDATRSNAVLVCHALTGDQYVASDHPITGKPGWWEVMIGPGRPIDTDRFFVICPNILGGCMGSTGPASINPQTGKA